MITSQFVAIDFTAAVLGALIAYVIRFGGAVPAGAGGSVDLPAAVIMPLAWVAVVSLNRAYDLRFVGAGTIEFGRVFRAFLYLVVTTSFISYAGDLQISRGFLLLAPPLVLVLSWSGRYLARMRVQRLRRAGRSMNRVLVVGSAASVVDLAKSMSRDLSAGLHVVAACLPAYEADHPGVRLRLAECGIPVLGNYESVRVAVERGEVSSVAVVAGDVGTDLMRTISWELEGSGADLIVSSGMTEVARQRVHVQSVAGLPLLRVDEPTFAGFRRVLKGTFDRTVAALALLLLSPVLIVLATLVRCTSRGPAFYRQTRIGLHGTAFKMIKFRSMQVGADAELATLAAHNEAADGLLFKMRDDPRVTRVGRFLRRFSLDELPQLFNILTGSMSLVGPRPPLESEVARYASDVRRRLLVKPGLTGLWQVSGRSDLSWEDSVRLDLHYVENWSFSLDLVVLLKTARVVVKATGAY